MPVPSQQYPQQPVQQYAQPTTPQQYPPQGYAAPQQYAQQPAPPAIPGPRPPAPFEAETPEPRAAAGMAAGGNRGLLIWGGVIAGLAVLAYVLSHVAAMSAGRVKAVSNWQDHTTADDTMALHLPADWKITEGSAQGIKTRVTAQQSSLVGMTVVGSDVTSWLGDILKPKSDDVFGQAEGVAAGMEAGFALTADAPPEQKVHDLFRREMEDRYAGYEEGPKESLRMAGAAACKADITFRKRCGLVKVRMRGVRITALGAQRGYSIVAFCPARAYSDFEPTLAEILSGMRLD
jgi:hypothetical protein